jgi:hypothetical protein
MEPNELFTKFVKGKTKIKLNDVDLELDMKVSERIAVLSFYSATFRAGITQNIIKQTLIDDVVKSVNDIFVRSYPGVDPGVIGEFVKSRFEDIIFEIAKSVGWINEQKLKEEIDKLKVE